MIQFSVGFRHLLVAWATVCACGACDPYLLSIEGKQLSKPLAIYAEWWVATEQCSRMTGQMERITWFTADDISTGDVLGRGLWRPPHEIVIARGYEEDETIVRHEMLHDLLGGDPEHSEPSWRSCNLLLK